MKLVSALSAILVVVSPSCHRGTDYVVNAFSPPSFPIIRHNGGSSSRVTMHASSSSAAVEEEVVAEPPVIKEKEQEEKSLTQRIMESTSTSSQQATGAGGSSTWDAFQRTELNWSRLKSSKSFDYDVTNLSTTTSDESPPPQFVTSDGACGNPNCWSKLRSQSNSQQKLDYDVTLCGGTLGIFIAMALQLKGHNVAVIEAGKLMGREQEWNISMKELDELIDMGVLTTEDVDEAIKTEFPGCRAGFKNREGEYTMHM